MPGLGALHAPELIPPQYNAKSELTATVTEEGPNEFNFDLEKGRKEDDQEEVSQAMCASNSPVPAAGRMSSMAPAPMQAGPEPVPSDPSLDLIHSFRESVR